MAARLSGTVPLPRSGQQSPPVALTPSARPARLRGHLAPVVGKAGVPSGGGLSHDRVRPVVIVDQRLGYAEADPTAPLIIDWYAYSAS